MTHLELLDIEDRLLERQAAQSGPLAQKAAEGSAQQQPGTELAEVLELMRQEREAAELKRKMNSYLQWERELWQGLRQMARGGWVNTFGDGDSLLLNQQDLDRNNWRWADIDSLQDDDPLYKTIDPTDSRWVVDGSGRLVPKSTVMNWVNSYERQLPYQDQPDIATAGEVEKAAADRQVKQSNSLPSMLPIGKRLVEVAMRNSGGEPGINTLFEEGLPDVIQHPRKAMKTLGYILNGDGLPDYANVPSMGTRFAYNGFWTPNNVGFVGEPVSNKNDIISAFLGMGDIRSDLAEKQAAGKRDSLINANTPFSGYIAENYPEKDISLYKLKGDTAMYRDVPKDSVGYIQWEPWRAVGDSDFHIMPNGWVPDWGGHQRREGRLPGNPNPVVQQADIWKFKTDDYNKKYGLLPIEKWLFDVVDKIGNPVVTYTQPYFPKSLGHD